MIIYKITNIVNNKIYIGLTTQTLKERMRMRFKEAKTVISSKSYINNAIRKYGEEAFVYEQIDIASTLNELKEKERFYIKTLNTRNSNIGYNLSEGGDGTPGVLKSKETRDKIRSKALGRRWSDKTRVAVMNGRKNVNIDFSKGLDNCIKHNMETSKSVEKTDQYGKILCEYISITSAAAINGINRSTIIRHIKKGSKNSCKGYYYKVKQRENK